MFTKQHYEAIANCIRATETRQELIQAIKELFISDNPEFDQRKFKLATI